MRISSLASSTVWLSPRCISTGDCSASMVTGDAASTAGAQGTLQNRIRPAADSRIGGRSRVARRSRHYIDSAGNWIFPANARLTQSRDADGHRRTGSNSDRIRQSTSRSPMQPRAGAVAPRRRIAPGPAASVRARVCKKFIFNQTFYYDRACRVPA